VREFKAKVMRDAGEGGSGEARKSWQWRRWSWDGSSLLSEADLVEFLSEFQISIEMAHRLALVIQSVYRGFLARKKFKGVKGERDERRVSIPFPNHESSSVDQVESKSCSCLGISSKVCGMIGIIRGTCSSRPVTSSRSWPTTRSACLRPMHLLPKSKKSFEVTTTGNTWRRRSPNWQHISTPLGSPDKRPTDMLPKSK